MDRDFFRKYLDILSESSPPQIIEESIELHDSFDIELNENFIIETGIIGFTNDGIIVEADETLLGLLEVHDILCEDETYDQEEEEVAEGIDDETMISAYQDHKTTQKDGKVSDEFTSKSFARNPATGTGSYHIKKQKDGEVSSNFQRNVSKPWMDYTEKGGQAPMTQFRSVNEAEYQGRKVQLGKPMAGDVKKSKVYVRKPNGKIVKVNFGDKKMKIKKSNPKRRKSFRARHRCENPGPRWKARYWSCRAW